MSSISLQPDAVPEREGPGPALAGAVLPLAGLALVIALSGQAGGAGSCGGVSPDQYVMAMPPAPVAAG